MLCSCCLLAALGSAAACQRSHKRKAKAIIHASSLISLDLISNLEQERCNFSPLPPGAERDERRQRNSLVLALLSLLCGFAPGGRGGNFSPLPPGAERDERRQRNRLAALLALLSLLCGFAPGGRGGNFLLAMGSSVEFRFIFEVQAKLCGRRMCPETGTFRYFSLGASV